jgi:uncharacterized RDD family membrane protein YckC
MSDIVEVPGTPAGQRLFSVETPEAVAFAYELAGIGSRGLALALDMLAIALLAAGEFAIAAVVYFALNAAISGNAALVGAWVFGTTGVLAFGTYWGYFVYGEVFRNGRTWGKGRMGLRVVRDDGSRVAVLDSVIRNVLRLVDMLPGNYLIGMGCVIFSRRNKRLGDMAAGTVVVRDSGEIDGRFDGGEVSKPMALAREFLDRRAGLTPEARYQVGVAVLATFGEEPAAWDEPTVAGRLADLSGWRQMPEAVAPALSDETPAPAAEAPAPPAEPAAPPAAAPPAPTPE